MLPRRLAAPPGCRRGAWLTTLRGPLPLRVLGQPCSVPPGCSRNPAGCPHAPQGCSANHSAHPPAPQGALVSQHRHSQGAGLPQPGGPGCSLGPGTHRHVSGHWKWASASASWHTPVQGPCCGQGRLPRPISEGLGGSLAGSRPARLPLPLAQAHAIFSGCFGAEPLPGAGDGGHGTPSSLPAATTPKSPLGELAASVLAAARRPRGRREKPAIKERGQRSQGNAWEGMHFCMRGERAGIPLAWSQGHSRSPAKLPPSPGQLLGTALAPFPAPSWGQDAQLRAGEGVGPAPHLGARRDFALICCGP